MSKAKKIIVIAAVIVIAAGAAFFVVKSNNEKKRYIESCAEILLQYGSFNDEDRLIEMLSDQSYRYYSFFYRYKDKPQFEEAVAGVIERMIDPEDETGILYYETTEEKLCEAAVRLEELGIHSEEIKGIINGYLTQVKNDMLTGGEDTAAKDDDADISRDVVDLMAMLDEADSEYYLGDIFTENERISYFRAKLDNAIAKDDHTAIARNMAVMENTGYLRKVEPDLEWFIYELTEQMEVYTITPGNGGFYDPIEANDHYSRSSYGASGMQSIGYESRSRSERFYGDFKVVTETYTSHVDGLVDEASKEKYNKSSSNEKKYFRQELEASNIDADMYREAIGAKYALCHTDNDAVHVLIKIAPDSIYFGDLFANNTDYDFGDFSEYIEKAAAGDADEQTDTDEAAEDVPEPTEAADASVETGELFMGTYEEYAEDPDAYAADNAVRAADGEYGRVSGDFSDAYRNAEERYRSEYSFEYSTDEDMEKAISELEAGNLEAAEEIIYKYRSTSYYNDMLYEIGIELIKKDKADIAISFAQRLPLDIAGAIVDAAADPESIMEEDAAADGTDDGSENFEIESVRLWEAMRVKK